MADRKLKWGKPACPLRRSHLGCQHRYNYSACSLCPSCSHRRSLMTIIRMTTGGTPQYAMEDAHTDKAHPPMQPGPYLFLILYLNTDQMVARDGPRIWTSLLAVLGCSSQITIDRQSRRTGTLHFIWMITKKPSQPHRGSAQIHFW